jgi:hypothetical protein
MVVQETSYPGLESWQQRVLDQLDARLPEGPDYGAIQTESAYITAAAVLLRRMQAGVFTNANWRDREIGTFFGDWHANDFHGGFYRSSPLVKCIRQWLELVGGGADVHGATKLLLTDPQRLEETLGTPTADQLRRCRLSRPARESENAWQYVENVWREQALRLLDTALAELVEAIDDLRAPAAPVLLAHSRYNSNDFSVTPYTSNRESVVVAVQKVIVANGRAVITTHPTVAEYLVPESGRYSDWSGAVKRETVPSEDILETALMLWSPRERDSSYVKFEEALEAAEVL